MSNQPETTHSLERTSSMGEALVGRCVLCGDVDLPMTAATWPCTNPRNVTGDQALIDAIDGDYHDDGIDDEELR